MIGHTLFLTKNWDITLDAVGHIKTTNDTYAIAQNAANSVRLFKNDAYFAQTKGIPHFDIELGKKTLVSLSILRSRIKNTVLGIEGVRDAEVLLKTNSERTRILGGTVDITLVNGTSINIEI